MNLAADENFCFHTSAWFHSRHYFLRRSLSLTLVLQTKTSSISAKLT